MKRGWILRVFIIWLVTLSLFINTLALAASEEYNVELEKCANRIDHFVPVNKSLSSQWIQELYARGSRKPYNSNELNTIGMPIGGIGTGQLYLCGDGTLGCWEIFNRHKSLGTGARNYKYRIPEKPVDQGFAVIVNSRNGPSIRRLNQKDFQEVEFLGEYPIGTVRYRQRGFPIAIELEAFSPFIPLNATDSALPATMFQITIENISTERQKVAILGWLENAVCIYSAKVGLMASRCTDIINEKGRTLIVHTTKEKMAPGSRRRKSVLLADFEQDDYGDWKVQGEAFGKGPAKGTLPNQQSVSGFLGKGLVNTYLNRDGSQGTLTSPVFEINRRYLNFLIGGGGHEGKTCMNLLINGRVVYTATGANDEKLMWRSWDLRKYEGKEARIEIVDHASGGGWGHINVDHIELSDKRDRVIKLRDKLEDDGSMVLALAQGALPAAQAQRLMAKLSDSVGEIDFSEQSSYGLKDRKRTGIVSPEAELEPGSKHTFTFLLSWFFPNCQNGHYYASRFNDAVDVATYILDNEKRLTNETRLWHKTYYLDSTLPYWLLVRLHAPISTLATGTCQLWKNGRFWAYEGVVCCPGTCTHVWNYAQAMARLFPQLERSVREMQDYGPAFTHQTGLVGYRGGTRGYAADGQCGTILKTYREHQMSADYRFLRKNWAKIKKSLEFLIKQDGNEDGLIENGQHNTFDRSFFGANTFVGSLYLAALRAGEEMSREMGDLPFAVRCQRIYQSGRNLSVERLWNGEYFIQDVELNLHPKFQYADGCLSDQMFGQNWAHQLELSYLYPEKIVKASLKSVWKYNWTPDVATHTSVHEPERCFAGSCEPGLFNCTWPKSKHLEDKGVRYRNEVWTGVEYQVASGMIWEGMTKEGLSIVKGIHDRYHPLKRNPWNEVECGDHYARALASWGVFAALCGYQYHGPKGHLSFDPKIAMDDFRAAFTTAEGWGLFSQHRQLHIQENRIEVRSGKLTLRTLALGISKYVRTPEVSVQLSGKPIKASSTIKANQLVIRFREKVELKRGEFLDVLIKL